MNSEQNIFNLAYLLLQPHVGQKYLKDLIRKKIEVKNCPNEFVGNLKKEKIEIIPFWDKRYPFLLKQTSDFPVFLFAKGDTSILEKGKFVTLVGSRNITDYSFKLLNEFFEKKRLFSKEICFVSGLAYGVDSEIHRLCLKKSLSTIGVVAGGLDRVYYRGNSVMYRYLCNYRLVLSEFPPGRSFFKGMFPLRNRILAGISEKTFIIQAAKKSGALNTAGHANNYGREVFIVPNDIFCEYGQGCLKLLSEGANVVQNIGDLTEHFI